MPGSTSDLASSDPGVSGPFGDVVATLRAAGCVFAEDEACLLIAESGTSGELAAAVKRRTEGEPLEQILGWAEFCGLRVVVTPGVFVPRRRTELLVREAVSLAGPGSVVVDLCCGSGAVALAISRDVGCDQVHAVDIDPAAVRCARLNAAGATGHVYEGDLDRPLPSSLRGRVDVMTVNAPYVPSAEIQHMPAEARVHENLIALDGGSDGLDIQRRVVGIAPRWLRSGGHLLIETSERQAPETAKAFADEGFHVRVARSEELSSTVVVGTWPAERLSRAKVAGEPRSS